MPVTRKPRFASSGAQNLRPSVKCHDRHRNSRGQTSEVYRKLIKTAGGRPGNRKLGSTVRGNSQAITLWLRIAVACEFMLPGCLPRKGGGLLSSFPLVARKRHPSTDNSSPCLSVATNMGVFGAPFRARTAHIIHFWPIIIRLHGVHRTPGIRHHRPCIRARSGKDECQFREPLRHVLISLQHAMNCSSGAIGFRDETIPILIKAK
jgi:hypothetical protein